MLATTSPFRFDPVCGFRYGGDDPRAPGHQQFYQDEIESQLGQGNVGSGSEEETEFAPAGALGQTPSEHRGPAFERPYVVIVIFQV